MHDYAGTLLIATMYILLLQIIERTFLNSNVSDLGIRSFNITSLSFHYRFVLILLRAQLKNYSPSVCRDFERHNIRYTLAQHSIFEIESVARAKRRQGLRLGTSIVHSTITANIHAAYQSFISYHNKCF